MKGPLSAFKPDKLQFSTQYTAIVTMACKLVIRPLYDGMITYDGHSGWGGTFGTLMSEN